MLVALNSSYKVEQFTKNMQEIYLTIAFVKDAITKSVRSENYDTFSESFDKLSCYCCKSARRLEL